MVIVQYQSSADYCASLAHKMNHSFTPNCEWDNAEHPVFGLIPAVRYSKLSSNVILG
jgi:histone-lysine N-methyltransferase SETD7